MTDVLIIGAGLFGLTVGRRLAEEGRRVTVLESRGHIGGNVWSDEVEGIEVHRYGAHIFHTSNETAWEWATRFSDFTPYRHHVWSRYGGRLHPLPFGLATLSSLLGREVSPEEGEEALGRVPIEDPANLRERALALIGAPMSEAFVIPYTEKQWGTPADCLPASTINRLPFRMTHETGYFTDPHQGLPSAGYRGWVERMADHPLLEVRTGERWTLPASGVLDVPTVYSGPLDGLFGHRHGALGWRTCTFETEVLDVPDYQGAPVINIPDPATPYTRIMEWRHFRPERGAPTGRTVVTRETPGMAGPGDEPYYPIGREEDREMVARYLDDVRSVSGLTVGGRLGRYAYLDMDQTISSALAVAARLLGTPRSAGSGDRGSA